MICLYYCREGENEELRYSLRSASQFLDMPVMIVGGKPDWCHPDMFLANRTPLEKYGSAHANIIRGLEYIIDNPNVVEQKALVKTARLKTTDTTSDCGSRGRTLMNDATGARTSAGAEASSDFTDTQDDVCLMMDDIFLCAPYPANRNRGTLKEQYEVSVQLHGRNAYNDYILRTLQQLNNWGISNPLSYEMHAPFYCNSRLLLDLIKNKLAGGEHSRFLLRSLYGNLYPKPTEEALDRKLVVGDKLKLYRVFSTNEQSFEQMKDKIAAFFPNPCRHEQL